MHGKNTSNYNKDKRVDDLWHKAIQEEEMMRPPPALEEEAIRRKNIYEHH